MESHSTFALIGVVFLIVVRIFGSSLQASSVARNETSNPFMSLHRGLLALLILQWLLVVAAKLLGLSLLLASVVLLGSAGFLTVRAGILSKPKILSFIATGFIVLTAIPLAQFGAPISQWDGNAHLTFINAMTSQGSASLQNLFLLDENLQPFEPFHYYPYLAHSLIATAFVPLPTEAVVRPAAYLAASIVLALSAISGLVVAVRRVIRFRSGWHAFALFALGLAVPAFFFSAVHHGSFSRALATTLALTTYLCVVGRYGRFDIALRVLAGVLGLSLHLQGAVLVGILASAEILVAKPHRSRRRLFAFVAAGAAAFLLALLTLAGEHIDSVHLESDVTHELFEVWRIQVISGLPSFLGYTWNNLFVANNILLATVLPPLVAVGAFRLYHRRRIMFCTVVLFAVLTFSLVALLLLLPDGPLLRALAMPFAGAVSRPYEGLAIAVAFVAGVGLAYLLQLPASRWQTGTAMALCVLLIGIPAFQMQANLIVLADHFKTLRYDLAVRMHDVFAATRGPDLVIATDMEYFALADGKDVVSYLAYYDCPIPGQNTPECAARTQRAGQVIYAAESGEMPADMSDWIRAAFADKFAGIFVVVPDASGDPRLLRLEAGNDGGLAMLPVAY